MKPLSRFWNEGYGVEGSLETDSRLRRLLNTYVVARLMNAFPKTATKVFARSRGELARRLFVEKEGGSYRVLRTMYEFEEPHRQGDLLNRLLMQSPAVKAARNRRKIAQWMLRACLNAVPRDKPRLVLAIGGGDGRLEAEVIAGLDDAARQDVYYLGIDMDERAVAENKEVLETHGLSGRGFTLAGRIADERDVEALLRNAADRFHVEFDGISIAVCQGIAEYLDIGSDANQTLSSMLGAVHGGTRPGGALMISQTDFHDRVTFLERGLDWTMRLRSSGELAAEVERAAWQIVVCEHEPMELITMCLAAKPDVRRWRLDDASPLRRPHIARHAAASQRRLLRRSQ